MFQTKLKWASISTLQVATSLCFLQNHWSYIFWKIFKSWDSFNIWDLLNITIHSILWTKFGSLSVLWTLELAKTQCKYFVLEFHSNHGLFGRNLHNQNFLWSWISCLRVKSYIFHENRLNEKLCSLNFCP